MLSFILRSRFVNRRNFWVGLSWTVPIACFFTPLLAHAYLGSFARYLADDYCAARLLFSKGLLGAQRDWYMTFTGKFSWTLALSIAELVGPRLVPLLPSIALTLWLAGMTWTNFHFALIVRLPHPVIASLFLAELIIFATLDSIPNVLQSLHWQMGMLAYVAPLILLTIYVGFIGCTLRRKSHGRPSLTLLILSAILTFIAGGFSETYVALQTGGLFLAIVVCMMVGQDSFKRTALPLIVAGFVGSALAMAVIILAPGNVYRQAYFPRPPGLLSIATSSLIYALYFVGQFGIMSPLTTAVSLVFPAILAFKLHPQELEPAAHLESRQRRLVQLLVLSPVVGFILIVCSFAPSFYGMSSPPPDRALVIPQFILVCVTVCWAYLAGLCLRQCQLVARRSKLLYVVAAVGLGAGFLAVLAGIFVTPSFIADHFSPDGVLERSTVQRVSTVRLRALWVGSVLTLLSLSFLVLRRSKSLHRLRTTRKSLLISASVVVVVLLALGPIASAWRTFALSPMLRAHALRWDSRDREIRAARRKGFADLTVPVLDNPAGLEAMGPDPNHWVNECAAGYYGLESIVAH